MTDWIMYPLLPYVLMVVSLGLCLHLFLTVKGELRLLQKRGAAKQKGLEEAVREVGARLDQALNALQESRSPESAGITLGKRGQVLRMAGRGESAATIAAALEVPRNEIDLMLKVHRMTVRELPDPIPAVNR